MENPFENQITNHLSGVYKLGIHSGKGGVGKTFLSVNLAYSLAAKGFKIGLLDADIDCPNVSKFLALNSLARTDAKKIYPVLHNNVKLVSSALLNPSGSENPLIIRGPIKHNMLLSFLSSVEWGQLDYLVMDLPPGTADVPLSAMQLSAIDGLILISAPTKESLLDTARACNMAKKLQVKILGLVENMSGEIFGSSGEKAAKHLEIPYLGSIPLSRETAKINEAGEIAFLENPTLENLRSNLVDTILKASNSQ